MISNFSEVEKSLKRCLKEKVSITAATVVGFLIAGTVAFGGTDVTFTTVSEESGKVTVKVDGTVTTIADATDSISVEQYEALTKEGKALAGLLTVTTDDTRVLTFAGVIGGDDTLGTVSATATDQGALTLIKTDNTYKEITSSLEIEASGATDKEGTAMLAAGEGHTVTNAAGGKITAKAYGVGMKANAGATAENTGTIAVDNENGIGMLASGKDAKATNKGTFTVTAGTGMSAENGGTIENTDSKTIAISSAAGKGMVVTGNGTATNAGTIEVNNAASIGMSATTKAEEKATLINNGKIDVQAGTGISVTGDGTAEVTAGEISVADDASNVGINIAGAGTTTVTGGTITLTGAAVGIDGEGVTGELKVDGTEISVATGTGIKATGNVELKDIAITLTGTGTGIIYDASGAAAKTVASISTKNMEVESEDAKGITATMSGKAGSTLDITTGIISTGHASATGIIVTGTELSQLDNGETPTTATVTTTLGETKGIGVSVAGNKNNTITVNLGANDGTATAAETTTKAEVSGTGVEIASNEAAGKVVVNVNQKNLKVAEGKELVKVTTNVGDATINAKQAVELLTTANLVDIGATGGNITVNLNADKQAVATGSLVNVGAITGTTNVNINKDVAITGKGGNIVKAAANLGSNGILNINLNVKEGSLNVKEGKTAINLEAINTDDKASVKNTENVTIEGKGILVAGSTSGKTTTLTNQGLIDLKVVDKDNTEEGNSIISTGTKVNVANYGTIKLDISSAEFIANTETGIKKSLDQLTTEEVAKALKALGVIAANSDGTFSSIGYIEFNDAQSFTTAKALDGEATVAGLASTLAKQPEGEKGFEVKKGDALTLTSESEKDKLENVQLNLKGTMKTDGSEETVVIDNSNSDSQILIREDGKIEVASGTTLDYSGNILASEDGTDPAITIEDGGTLTLSNGTLTVGPMPAEKNEYGLMTIADETSRVGIKLAKTGDINLIDSTINADIVGTLNSDALQGKINSTGISVINNKVTDIKTINVTGNGMLTFGADSAIVVSAGTKTGEKTTIDLTNGKMKVELGEGGANILKNTENESLAFEGTYGKTSADKDKGKVVLATNNLTENTTFELGNHDGLTIGDIITDGDIYYNIVKGNGNNWTAQFNEDALLEATGTKYLELGNIFVGTQSIHDLLSKDIDERAAELDNIYSNNIYSETVKMSLDTLKMNEDAVLSLNVRPKQGEFTAQGKFLFNNTDYDREGVLKDYKVETKNKGLLGALEYGLTDTSSVGFAFSGTKQDLDMKNGASADGDAFYFGLYRNDKFNNIDLTTGLGYMTDRVDAKSFVGKDKFDSTAFSGYIQGKYNYAIGENLTLSPKARLTVTRFQQDSINTGRMKQEEIKDTMADVELGVELKKGIALETGKMNLLAGASFTTNIAGKDDDFYRVDFLSNTGKANSTKVKGANLEKNSLKLNLGADVELTNGVFYNGGLSYEFDDEDRDSIGVTLGAGYKF